MTPTPPSPSTARLDAPAGLQITLFQELGPEPDGLSPDVPDGGGTAR